MARKRLALYWTRKLSEYLQQSQQEFSLHSETLPLTHVSMLSFHMDLVYLNWPLPFRYPTQIIISRFSPFLSMLPVTFEHPTIIW